jgi:hypothetical protein
MSPQSPCDNAEQVQSVGVVGSNREHLPVTVLRFSQSSGLMVIEAKRENIGEESSLRTAPCGFTGRAGMAAATFSGCAQFSGLHGTIMRITRLSRSCTQLSKRDSSPI